MQLIYTDESGINYSNQDGLFKDGFFIFYGGLCVDDKKYFHLERLFIDLIKSFFSIDDWRGQEIHGTNIWLKKGYFSKYTSEVIFSFFNELLQLVTKLDIKFVLGQQIKTLEADNTLKVNEEAKAIYSFLHGVESYLSRKSETGIIIADGKLNSETSLLKKIFDQRSNWRFQIKNQDPIIKTKYHFESRLCFILDNIHYVNSKESMFIQIADIVLYVIMRVWTYQNLRLVRRPIADISKVPIDKYSFLYFFENCMEWSSFDKGNNDVIFHSHAEFSKLHVVNDRNQILSDDFFRGT